MASQEVKSVAKRHSFRISLQIKKSPAALRPQRAERGDGVRAVGVSGGQDMASFGGYSQGFC